ncbi:MAG: hypothetical protein LWY06_07190 [Firmicutes bacterium]|nr:hypothetical protein [Bacillota bacterium]
MQISPLKEYKPPGFPESDKISANKTELYKFVPERWKKAIAVTGTALSLLLGSPDAGNCREIIRPSGLGVKTATTGSLWSVGGRIAESRRDPTSDKCDVGGIMLPPIIVDEASVRNFIIRDFADKGIKFDKRNYNVNPGGSPIILDEYSTPDRFGYMVINENTLESIKEYGRKKDKYIENAEDAAVFIEKDLQKNKNIRCVIFHCYDSSSWSKGYQDILTNQIRNCLRKYRIVSR